MNSKHGSQSQRIACALGLAGLIFFSTITRPADARQQQYLPWKQLAGLARDVGVGPDPKGDIWIIGTNSIGGGDYGIYQWNRKTKSWDQKPGGAVRVDVGPGGPIVVNSAGGLYVWNGSGWDHRGNNRIRDVGVGGDGSVWYLGGEEHPGGFEVFKYGGPKVSGSGVRIDVDNKGNPWIVTKGGAIFRFNGSAFEQVPGPGVPAIDIGISSENGVVYVVGGDGWPYKWTGSGWQLSSSGISHALNHISVDPAGMPWGVAGNGVIYSSRDQAEYLRIGTLPPFSPPPPRKGITVINDSDEYSWVTIEQSFLVGPDTPNAMFGVPTGKASGCLAPGQESSWNYATTGAGRIKYKVRVERTRTQDCKPLPGNAHVTCDTHANWEVDSHTVVHGVVLPTGEDRRYMLFTFNDSCHVAVTPPK